jgi:Ca2+/Na+ antiporter
MILASGLGSASDIVFLFAAAGIVLYVASRAGADALTPLSDPSPGKLALAQWLPIAWTAVVATLAGHSEIGVGVVFASSVAALAMVLGILLCIAPPSDAAPVAHASAWPFIVPGAMVALLAGFGGALTLLHAVMLLVLGICVLGVWRGGERRGNRDERPAAAVAVMPIDYASPSTSPPPPPLPQPRVAAYQFVLALGLGAVGAWLAYKAIIVADERNRVATSGLVAMAVISPLLVLPLLGTGAIAAHHGRGGRATAAIVGIVLLNLLLLLPLVILAHYANQIWQAVHAGPNYSSVVELYVAIEPMPFPLAVWRVDTVLLIALGLMLIPVSLSRWPLRRAEGLMLAFLYAAYLIISTSIVIHN